MRFQWHPELHSQLGKERLTFWRMGFSPTYDREKVREVLLSLFKSMEISSYAFYEMIGIHDLMLRLWLPTSLPLGDFEAGLKAGLAEEGIMMIDYFAVDQMLAHWVWTDSEGSLRAVNGRILTEGLPEEDVRQINEGKLDQEDRNSYEKLNVIAPSGHGKGIKFFIVVSAGSPPTSMYYTPQMLRADIARIVRDAGAVKEKSIYVASGGLGRFLVMGKVRTAQFNKIFTELIDPINDLGLNREFRGRTYTHICTRGLVDFVDVLPPWREVVKESNIKPMEEYLSEEESRVLEVKGSAFIDVEGWLKGNKGGFDERILTEGVLRSITGMLNADGGTVLMGALENREPFIKASTSHDGPLADRPWFRDKYLIFGIEEDLRVAGSRKDWDSFLQRLNRKIKEKIDPQPSPWITIEPKEVLGRRMAVVSVREPDSDWFYLKDSKDSPGIFYVRLENETTALHGSSADGYKRGKARL